MHIVICEDMKVYQDRLCLLIRDCIEKEFHGNCEISVFDSGEELLPEYEAGKFNMIFMDYYMEGRTGLEIAREIRKQDEAVPIIFASSERMIHISGVRAIGILPKPYEAALVRNMLRSAVREEKEAEYIDFRSNGKTRRVLRENILYTQMKKDNCSVALMQDAFKADNVEETLKNLSEFFQCGREYILNCRHIKKLDFCQAVMRNGYHIPLGLKNYFILARRLRARP